MYTKKFGINKIKSVHIFLFHKFCVDCFFNYINMSNDDIVRTGNNGITYIPKDYLPRDKVNESHIVSIIGSRYKHRPDKVKSEIVKCQQMKNQFLDYARKDILKGYFECTKSLGWKVAGQDLTSFALIKKYIASCTWDEKLQKDLHFLQYKRFKVDIRYHRWDYKLSDDFCKYHKIEFLDESMSQNDLQRDGKKEQLRPCFVVIATNVKNDYNKKLRSMCEDIHGACIKERKDNIDDKLENNKITRHFHWNEGFVCTKPVRKGQVVDDKETIENLKKEVARLKNEISELKQKENDFDTMDIGDINFDELFVSALFLHFL